MNKKMNLGYYTEQLKNFNKYCNLALYAFSDGRCILYDTVWLTGQRQMVLIEGVVSGLEMVWSGVL